MIGHDETAGHGDLTYAFIEGKHSHIGAMSYVMVVHCRNLLDLKSSGVSGATTHMQCLRLEKFLTANNQCYQRLSLSQLQM